VRVCLIVLHHEIAAYAESPEATPDWAERAVFAALIRRLPKVLERSPGWSPQARACAGTATWSQQVTYPNRPGRPPIDDAIAALIEQMARENQTSGRQQQPAHRTPPEAGKRPGPDRRSPQLPAVLAGHPVIGQMQIRVDSMEACPARACTASKAIPASRSRIRRPGSPPKDDQRPERIFVGRYHDPHQGTAPSSLNGPPVGPSAGSSARCTAIAAPCAAVRSTFRPRAG
jgi:hypothetical protein